MQETYERKHSMSRMKYEIIYVKYEPTRLYDISYYRVYECKLHFYVDFIFLYSLKVDSYLQSLLLITAYKNNFIALRKQMNFYLTISAAWNSEVQKLLTSTRNLNC